jgi:chromosome partitioning protein
MAQVLTVASVKGGVGKTTVAVNLAAGLASLGRYYRPEKPFQVLLIDLDPSCNSLSTIGSTSGYHTTANRSIITLLKQSPPPSPQPFLKQSDYHPNLWFFPSNRLDFAEFIRDDLGKLAKREDRLARALKPVRDWFEFIIIDTPASPITSYIFSNAFMASSGILLCVEPAELAVDGMQALIAEINQSCADLDHEVPILGIIPTKVKKRGSIGLGLMQEINRRYKDLVTPPSHMSELIERMYLDHKDLFASSPLFWEKRSGDPAEEKITPVSEFGSIILDLLVKLGYDI